MYAMRVGGLLLKVVSEMFCKMISKAATADNEFDTIANMLKSIQKQGFNSHLGN